MIRELTDASPIRVVELCVERWQKNVARRLRKPFQIRPLFTPEKMNRSGKRAACTGCEARAGLRATMRSQSNDNSPDFSLIGWHFVGTRQENGSDQPPLLVGIRMPHQSLLATRARTSRRHLSRQRGLRRPPPHGVRRLSQQSDRLRREPTVPPFRLR